MNIRNILIAVYLLTAFLSIILVWVTDNPVWAIVGVLLIGQVFDLVEKRNNKEVN